eukprot:TRINITY_DN5809_c0_g1_i1.p1 TRINITY_DN5809_c0_g1~~TRINITY_DN5809_c0_g1_i1.p1  ORF type:complete len:325 (-),score=55.82 TRINITY_DN5809_c0_g1_i1:99-1073(-)
MALVIGSMDPSLSVSRNEILNWLNSFLGLSYQKIEDTATGAAACQVTLALHPGSLDLSQVNFNSTTYKADWERNYVVLETAFKKMGILKTIPITDLMRGKYRDNLEFCQWLYSYWRQNWSNSAEYPAKERRLAVGCTYPGDSPEATAPKPQPQRQRRSRGTRIDPGATPMRKNPIRARVPSARIRVDPGATPARSKPRSAVLRDKDANRGQKGPSSMKSDAALAVKLQTNQLALAAAQKKSALLSRNLTTMAKAAKELQTQTKEFRSQNTELKKMLDQVEVERNFYFEKLREIEIMVDQEMTAGDEQSPASTILTNIQTILYKA